MALALSNSSCTLAWTSVGAACSGNGACVASPALGRDVCKCDDGWSGNSDFRVTSSLTNCQISYVIIRVMWAVLLAMAVVSYAVTFPKVRLLWGKHVVLVDKARTQGRRYGLRDNKALSNLLIMAIVGMPAFVSMCILKLAQPEWHIGAHWGPTILWWITRSCVYLSTFSFQPALLASLLGNQAGFEGVVRLNNHLSNVVMFFAIISGGLAVWPLVVDVDTFNPVPGVTAFLFLGSVLTLAASAGAVQTVYIERKIVHTLNKSMEIQARNERTLEIRTKLSNLQKSLRSSLMLQVLLYGFLTVFPYMWMLHDYFLPISWIVIALVYHRMPISIIESETSRRKKGSTTSGGGGGTGETGDKAQLTAGLVDRRGSGPETLGSGSDTLAVKGTQVESGEA